MSPRKGCVVWFLRSWADNALDAGARARVREMPGGGYYVEDDGPGIDGTPEQIARLFSINRPMVSTKQLRLPTRGALGNGLRVVAGAVLASNGFLVVTTRNQRIVLKPEHEGSTAVVEVRPVEFPAGTRIEISLGATIPEDGDALVWASFAVRMGRSSSRYTGKSSPYWYDAPHFHELLLALGSEPVCELVANVDGCTGARAGEIVSKAGLGRMVCKDVSREQATRLLEVARSKAKEASPKHLGAVGPELFPSCAYAMATGTVLFGTCVNRTPVTGNIRARRDKRDIDIFGCGLGHTVATAPKDKEFIIFLNVTTPYMPITSDGKEPNLEPFLPAICEAAEKAVRKARRPDAKTEELDNFLPKRRRGRQSDAATIEYEEHVARFCSISTLARRRSQNTSETVCRP